MLGKALTTAAAGNAAGEGLYVEEIFSTYLYTGNGTSQTITNGIDLDGEGGLWITKNRVQTDPMQLSSTEQDLGTSLESNSNSTGVGVTDFTLNSDGYDINTSNGRWNTSGENYVSWTFRKAPKFFDVVTYTGTGLTAQNISHNLGSVPGCIIVKQLDNTNDWWVYHRGADATSPEDYVLKLNGTDARADIVLWNDTAPTDSVFTVYGNGTNATNGNFVAYLFAHNDGDGEFGEGADQDIIKCGSYTGNGSADGPEIDLGFEPQWMMLKRATNTSAGSGWYMYDAMRGVVTGGADSFLKAESSGVESSTLNLVEFNATGFKLTDAGSSLNASGDTYIYIAIRRGPMKTPESGTEVFAMDQLGQTSPTPPGYNSPFPVDLGIQKGTVASSWSWTTRLLDGGFLESDETQAYVANTQWVTDFQNGFRDTTATSTDYYGYMFRRAPGFFDVVAYEGDNSNDNKAHNLGVVPEMMIIKCRDTATNWRVYHKDEGELSGGFLNTTAAFSTSYDVWNDKVPTATEFFVTPAHSNVNAATLSYIAYLFATLPGVSKVGSYTGNGTSQTIDCGFSAGARFVMTKRVNSTGNWNVWDSERGIVAGNDPRLELNTSDAEDTGHDYIDPDNSGFIVNYVADDDDDSNVSGDEYIFLAIA